MYFAKMNINENIYEVYNNEKKLDSLIQKIFLSITTKTEIYDKNGGRYKFFDLDANTDNMSIVGNLGYIKAGIHSSYDPDKDSAIDVVDKNKLEYVTYYFDVQHEMLAYMTLPVLGKKKVLDIFSRLIKKESDIGVEFIQESNLNNLQAELKKFKKLSKLEVKLVPPNGDKEDFAALTSLSVDKIEESRATKISQNFQTQRKEGLKQDSELIKNTITSVGLGYAEAKFYGKDSSDEKIEVSTSMDTPYKKFVHPNSTKSHSVISEKGRSGITNILEYKTRTRLNMKK